VQQQHQHTTHTQWVFFSCAVVFLRHSVFETRKLRILHLEEEEELLRDFSGRGGTYSACCLVTQTSRRSGKPSTSSASYVVVRVFCYCFVWRLLLAMVWVSTKNSNNIFSFFTQRTTHNSFLACASWSCRVAFHAQSCRPAVDQLRVATSSKFGETGKAERQIQICAANYKFELQSANS